MSTVRSITTRRNIAGRWGLVAVAAICVLALAAVLLLRTTPPVQVTVVQPSREDMESSVATTGQVVPVEDFLARASTAGAIQKINVHLGDHVTSGELLVVIKDPYAASRVAAARATLQTTEVSAENVSNGGSQEDRISLSGERSHGEQDRASAARQLATVQVLQQSGGASQAEVRAAQGRLDAVNSTLKTLGERAQQRYSTKDQASWQARLAEARETLRAEQSNLANVRIVSPIAGTAYLIPANAYDFVTPGAEILHVADLTRLQIRAEFDEADIGKLHIGEAVHIHWEGSPDRVWHGRVARAPLASTHLGSRNVGLSILSIDDARGDLPANSNVTVTVIVNTRQRVLTVPREALHIEGAERFVYRVVEDHLLRTDVKTGLITLDRAEIIGGIKASDSIALHRLDNQDLAPGLKVETVHS